MNLEKQIAQLSLVVDRALRDVDELRDCTAQLTADVSACRGITHHAMHRMDNARQELENALRDTQVSAEPQAEPSLRVEVVDGYQPLFAVLVEALEQAQNGKGKERHANSLPFVQQPMQTISDSLNGIDGMLFQAAKKAGEAKGLRYDAARRELLGAINYLAGAVIWLDRHESR